MSRVRDVMKSRYGFWEYIVKRFLIVFVINLMEVGEMKVVEIYYFCVSYGRFFRRCVI